MTTHGQQVWIEIDVSRALEKLDRVLSVCRIADILAAIGQEQIYWIGRNLDEAGSVDGGAPWKRMAPVTIERRPLRQSGSHFSSPYQTLLRQSMVAEVREAAAQVSVGTNARYATFHHHGASRGNWRLPARPLLPNAGIAKDLAMRVLDGIARQVAAAGKG